VLALNKLLGWDRRRVMTWATHYEGALNDDASQLWREYSVFYIAYLLIPDSTKDKLTVRDKLTEGDREYLARRLEAAILFLPQCKGILLENYDWDAVVARVDGVLAEYGENLANVRAQYDAEALTHAPHPMGVKTTRGKQYIEDWVLSLQQLLGWDRMRSMTWATFYGLSIDDEDSNLFRNRSVFYVAFLLIPDSIKEGLTEEDREYLARRLEFAILGLPDHAAISLAELDWEASIARVDAILAEYGESLASVRRQYEE